MKIFFASALVFASGELSRQERAIDRYIRIGGVDESICRVVLNKNRRSSSPILETISDIISSRSMSPRQKQKAVRRVAFTLPQSELEQSSIAPSNDIRKDDIETMDAMAKRLVATLKASGRERVDKAEQVLLLWSNATADSTLSFLVDVRARSVARSIVSLCQGREKKIGGVGATMPARPMVDSFGLAVWRAWYWTMNGKGYSYAEQQSVVRSCKSVGSYPKYVAEYLVPLLVDYQVSGLEGWEIVQGDMRHLTMVAESVIERCRQVATDTSGYT